MFFNDQEPLNFNFYNENYQYISKHLPQEIPLPSKELVNLAQQENLACTVIPLFSCLYDKKIIVHSEQNSQDLEKYQKNNFLTVHYWAHALIAQDWYRYAKYDQSLNYNLEFKKDFLIYCRSWTGSRQYRLEFIDLCLSAGIGPSSRINFNTYDGVYYQEVFATNNKFEDWSIPNTASSYSSADYSAADYQESAIDVVLETVVDRVHLTEKILRPIACGKPFILMAGSGALEYLHRYGFKTFHGSINEDYDKISNLHERCRAIALELNRISSLDQESKQQVFKEIHQIAKENQERFFSQEFYNCIVSEFSTNILQALQEIEDSKQGVRFKQALQACQTQPKYLKEIINKFDQALIKPYLP